MAINRIHHQHFGVLWPVEDRALKIFAPVFNEVLHFMGTFLELLGLRLEPNVESRWLASVCAERVIAIIRSNSQRENRNRIAVVEPKQDRRFKLRSSRRCLSNIQNFRRRFRIATRFLGAHRRDIYFCDWNGGFLSITKYRYPFSKCGDMRS